MEQGTTEWFNARLGKATASRIADIMATTKSGPSASRVNYEAQLIAERISGVVAESFTSKPMQWGTDHEAQARLAYEFKTDNVVEEVGFVEHPTIAMSGASPDGLIGTDGMIEIKCPNTATHIKTLFGNSVEDKYVKQMQWQMICAGRKWCDFVSFDPRVGYALNIEIIRVKLDKKTAKEMTDAVITFLTEVDDKVSKLKERIRDSS